MKQLSMIGLEDSELPWLRLLIALLRHPDPVVREVACEALRYLEGMAARLGADRAAG
ncbi:MAG TPA: armadillo/beta-catenin-like repeat-containing protein [Bryobacteraceae bacterium]|nr:armadillo/beta-catenin-like repeat-containing protein [Bryobacteraceae bacterium]